MESIDQEVEILERMDPKKESADRIIVCLTGLLDPIGPLSEIHPFLIQPIRSGVV